LDGLRVVELAGTDSGARVTQFMADYGATVEMIEKPSGSSLRKGPGWPALGRGKRSHLLDIGTDVGWESFMGTLKRADVFVQSLRPETVDALGLRYSSLAEINPRLVVASITGFGRVGPLSHFKGYEGVVMAKLGLYQGFAKATKRPGPTFVSVPFASYCAAQATIQGILAALIEREKSGLGQEVETNLAQSLAVLDNWNWFLHMMADRYPDSFHIVESFDANGNPNSHQALSLLIAPTSDGCWLQFSQLQPHLFAAFLRALDMTDLMDDPQWSGLPSYESAEKRISVWERMIGQVGQFSLEQWNDIFDAEPNVFGELFRGGNQVLNHPALRELGWVTGTNDPVVGPTTQLGRPIRVVGETWTPSPSPLPGDAQGDGGVATPSWKGSDVVAEAATKPLEGMTILDLASWIAAPQGSGLLTDLGARVIHVESLDGDPVRRAASFPEVGGLKVMQGKESIAIDLSTDEGKDILRQLALRSSAVLQGYRAGVAEKLGMDGPTLRSKNPDLVYVNSTGYGQSGPYGRRPSYAPSIAVAAGLTMRNVSPYLGRSPVASLDEKKERATRLKAGTSSISTNADGISALGVANALLLGLLSAVRGNAPQLETTMLATTASANFDAIIDYEGLVAPEPDSELRGLSALYRLYESADGWVFLAAPKSKEWPDLCRALAPYAALQVDPRFKTARDRSCHDAELATELTDILRRRPGSAWETDLSSQNVACVVAEATVTERLLMSDEVGRASGYVADVTHPIFDEHSRLAPVIRFSRSKTVAKPGCLAGQHTTAILAELGMDDAQIAGLRERRVVS
jgi:crotonobetainyl-CoA:carnitine CoA-transferase CaiB-like acyl-CoA transferase